MTWFTPILMIHDDRSAAPYAVRVADSTRFGVVSGSGAGLGSARAASQWAWSAEPVRPTRPAPLTPAAAARAAVARGGACLRAPVEVLSQMSAAARAAGRSESEVWVEAAREWLRRREGEPGAPPAAAQPVAMPPRRVTRAWDDIDALLIALRAPAAALPDCAGAPAA